MALQADEQKPSSDKCPVDIDIYWPDTHKNPYPPRLWPQWLEKFKIALLAKHGMDNDELLRDPADKIQVPIPKTH